MSRRTPVASLAFALLLAATPVAAPTPTHVSEPSGAGAPPLVLLVRHAEKQAEPAGDPPLSAEGIARARALAAALRDSGVTAIVTTQLRRTGETAEPLATARGLTPEVVPIERGAIAAHVEATAAAIRRHAGGVVLVVGHANTVPAIVAALGGPRLPDICESVYGTLLVLVPNGARPHLVRSHYGAADPDPGPGCECGT